MKLKFLVYIVISAAFLLSSCGGDDDPASNQQPAINAQKYYPGNVGSRFSYANAQGTGFRTLTFTGTRNINETDYIIQNSFALTGLDSVSATTYFRRTDNGVYFYVDTTGLMGFFPDSLRPLLTFNIDREIIAFSSALDQSKPWSAYKMDVGIASLANINIIDLSAHYEGDENVTLNLTSGQISKSAKKIRYDFKLSIPNLNNLSTPNVRTFNARVWFAEDIGIVRLEGNGSIIGALGGGNINLGDTTRVITQSITDYDIKP